MNKLLEKLFPKESEQKPSSKLVERGLEALRYARDGRAMLMGDIRRVPSHFELRLSPGRYEELVRMDALRDLEFFYKDELMKDLAADKSRTFGDHTVHVRIASDPGLEDRELYGLVLNPERRPARDEKKGGTGRIPAPAQAPDADSTRVLDQEEEEIPQDDSATVLLDNEEPAIPRYVLALRFPDGTYREETLEGGNWIIGRSGSSGKPLPEGFRKLDLNLPPTVSREQLRLEIEGHSLLIVRLGKGNIEFADGQSLESDASRRIELGEGFVVEGVEMKVVRD